MQRRLKFGKMLWNEVRGKRGSKPPFLWDTFCFLKKSEQMGCAYKNWRVKMVKVWNQLLPVHKLCLVSCLRSFCFFQSNPSRPTGYRRSGSRVAGCKFLRDVTLPRHVRTSPAAFLARTEDGIARFFQCRQSKHSSGFGSKYLFTEITFGWYHGFSFPILFLKETKTTSLP